MIGGISCWKNKNTFCCDLLDRCARKFNNHILRNLGQLRNVERDIQIPPKFRIIIIQLINNC